MALYDNGRRAADLYHSVTHLPKNPSTLVWPLIEGQAECSLLFHTRHSKSEVGSLFSPPVPVNFPALNTLRWRRRVVE